MRWIIYLEYLVDKTLQKQFFGLFKNTDQKFSLEKWGMCKRNPNFFSLIMLRQEKGTFCKLRIFCKF